MLEIPNISIKAYTHDNSEVVRLIKVNLEQAKIWARCITKVGEYFQYYKKRSFVLAMLVLMQHSKFSWRTFEKKLINSSAKLTNQGSRNDFIVNLERLYNHNTPADKRIRLELYTK